MRTIGQNIRYYRKLRGYSQEKLAEMADINDKLVGFYETGKRIPPVINLVAIAEALEVTVDELCGVNTLEPGTECHRNGPAEDTIPGQMLSQCPASKQPNL